MNTLHTVVFPDVADMSAAEDVRMMLSEAVSKGGVRCDLSATERLTTPCLQLLLTAKTQCDAENKQFELKELSEACREAFELFGVTRLLIKEGE